jgi:nitrate/nitrite sensing protein
MNTTMLIYAGLIAAILTGVIITSIGYRKKQRLKRQAIGLSWLQSLRRLLSHIQQHRGLSNGFLNGGKDLLKDIHPLQRKISVDIGNIACIDAWIESNERWQSITQHWARLAGGFERNSAENNLTQHNNLIQSVLYLIDDMAQFHDLLLLKDEHNRPFHLSWRELLSAAEFIGQARAIGTGVAAAGSCDSISRIRLNYLCQKINENTTRVWHDLAPQESQRLSVDKLIACIDEQVVHERVGIQAADFFDVASQALDSLHEQYDSIVETKRWQ